MAADDGLLLEVGFPRFLGLAKGDHVPQVVVWMGVLRRLGHGLVRHLVIFGVKLGHFVALGFHVSESGEYSLQIPTIAVLALGRLRALKSP